MAIKPRVERPKQTIKTIITPLSSDLKTKAATAIQSVVTAIKNKHM
jgi:hypothetical protein